MSDEDVDVEIGVDVVRARGRYKTLAERAVLIRSCLPDGLPAPPRRLTPRTTPAERAGEHDRHRHVRGPTCAQNAAKSAVV